MLTFEQLEQRLNCAMPPFCGPCDNTHDGRVLSGDVNRIITALNAGNQSAEFDANQDGYVTPTDALKVINYINKLPSDMVDIVIDDADITGFNPIDVREAIKTGINVWATVADVGFWYVTSSTSAWHVTTATLYLGNGVHALGMATGGVIYVHNGIFPPGTHSGTKVDYYTGLVTPTSQELHWNPYGNDLVTVSEDAAHESGHLFGLGHLSAGCIMDINLGSLTPCAVEAAFMQGIYGPAKQ